MLSTATRLVVEVKDGIISAEEALRLVNRADTEVDEDQPLLGS